jgi:cytochrome oxidase assembly protein ShyY1
MYRFLASTRWVGWLLMVMVFAIVCAALSWWQWDRRAEVSAENKQVAANWDATPQEGEDAVALFSDLPSDKEFLPVRLRGEYLSDATLFVRQRTLSSALGMEVLVPFRTQEGTIVLIDRGWMKNGDGPVQEPEDVPAPPSGTVTITARLKAGEPDIGRDAPEGQIASIDLAGVAQRTGLDIAGSAYGLLASEEPAPTTRPAPRPKPEADEGMHWSYALQWAAFGVLFFVGFGYAARQQARINREDREAAAEAAANGGVLQHSARRRQRTKVIKPRRDGALHDEEAEDALIDAEERRGNDVTSDSLAAGTQQQR